MGTLAKTLVSGDQIIVNLTATRPDGSRLAVGHTFNAQGQQINAAGTPIGGRSLNVNAGTSAEPEFDHVRFTRLVKENLKQEADMLSVAYKTAVDVFRLAGGGTLQDRLANAVMEFCKAEYNVSTEDHDGPVIRPEQIVVKPVFRNNSFDAGVFIVMLSPTWGDAMLEVGFASLFQL